MNVISFWRAAGMQNSWEGIYLCQHGRRADYCRRWGRKVKVLICQSKGARQTSCHWPKALATHDSWIKFNLWVIPDFNRVNAFTFIVTSGLFPNGTMRFGCLGQYLDLRKLCCQKLLYLRESPFDALWFSNAKRCQRLKHNFLSCLDVHAWRYSHVCDFSPNCLVQNPVIR